MEVHKRGITACQVCDEYDLRPDGWCLLVDKDIYNNLKLDEKDLLGIFLLLILHQGLRMQDIQFKVFEIINM